MRMLKVLALALGMSTAMTTAASAAPLVGLLFGPAFAATIGGQLLGIVFGAVGSYAFSSLLGAIFPAEQTKEEVRDPTQVQYGERVSRSAVFGTVLIGGHLVHMNEYNNAKQLQYVAVLGDGWHTSIEGIYLNNEQLNVTPISVGSNNEHANYEVEDYEDVVDLRLHDGRPSQAADTSLVAQSDGWTSAKTFTGMAYAVADLKSDKEKFNGLPDFKWIVKGLRLYDPRKDTTVGGSGSHRFNDPSTWEYSANPAVQAYHFLRGFYIGGRRVLGVGYAASEISLDHATAAMNVCDETVYDPEGAARKRYECHMEIRDTDQFSSVMDAFCQAMGGYWSEVSGQIVMFAGKAQSSVLTIADGDLIAEEEMVFNPGRPGEVLMTGVHGTYMHSQDFQPTPYAAIEPAGFQLAHWYPHVAEMNFPQVQNVHQAYMLARQYLYANRLQASATIALDIKDVMVQLNDWITWDSGMPLIGERTFKVIDVRYNFPKRRMYLSMQEISADVFDDDATEDDIVEPPRVRPPAVYLTTVSNFGLDPLLLQGESGEQIPALEFTYDPILDPAVSAVEIHYRVAASGGDPAGPIFKATDTTPGDGVYRVTTGVTPGKTHEAFARLISAPGREVVDTSWVEADFPVGNMVTIAEVGDDTVTMIKLTQELRNRMDEVMYGLPARIDALVEEQELLASGALLNSTQYQRKVSVIKAQIGQAFAAVIQEQTARVEADSALASALTQVVAELGQVIASGLLKFEAVVDGGGSSATISMMVRASDSVSFADSGIFIKATADGMGGTTSEILMQADKIYFTDGVNEEQAVVFESGVLKLDVGRAGRITSFDGTSMIIDFDDPEIYMEA